MTILNHCPSTRITEVTSKIEGYFRLFLNLVFEPILEGRIRQDLTIKKKLDIIIDRVMTLEMEPGLGFWLY